MTKTTKDGLKNNKKIDKISKKENDLKKANTTNKKEVKTSTKKTAKTESKNIKKTTTKKASNKTKKSSSKNLKKYDILEYYDLPYRYNQTIVKILAQTPQMLFVYWDISDEDRLFLNNKYGKDFFANTKPILLVHNETMNYTFEIEINDFANSWYLKVNDTDCKYEIELIRRPKLYQNTIKEDYISITSSNKMNAPNDHILFEKFNPYVQYKNIKTGEIAVKNFSKLSNFKNMQEIYGIYNLYKEIYKNELFDELVCGDFKNPSSLSSS